MAVREGIRLCTRCVTDSSVPNNRFDENGVCSYCRIYDRLTRKYPLNEEGKRRLWVLISDIKKKGKGSRYDCVVGVSGGRDSMYSLYKAKAFGLRPLGIHFDNGWVSDIARENIKNASKRLGVEIRTIGSSGIKDYYKASIKASIPEVCLPCSVGIASVLYSTCVKENIKYIIFAISFRTEGIYPLSWNYSDGKYFKAIMKKSNVNTKGYNKIMLLDYLNYVFVKRIKIIQLPFYIPYNNDEIDMVLKKELGWQYGGKHHFDCTYKPFAHYVHVHKFRFDAQVITYSSLIRSGHMKREDALNLLKYQPIYNEEVEACLKALNISKREFGRIMKERPKTFMDYPNYYSFLLAGRPVFKLLSKVNMLPETIYEKLFEV